jgi:hypothetical protein
MLSKKIPFLDMIVLTALKYTRKFILKICVQFFPNYEAPVLKYFYCHGLVTRHRIWIGTCIGCPLPLPAGITLSLLLMIYR